MASSPVRTVSTTLSSSFRMAGFIPPPASARTATRPRRGLGARAAGRDGAGTARRQAAAAAQNGDAMALGWWLDWFGALVGGDERASEERVVARTLGTSGVGAWRGFGGCVATTCPAGALIRWMDDDRPGYTSYILYRLSRVDIGGLSIKKYKRRYFGE